MTHYDRLSALDASFLHMERLDHPMHVGAMSVLEDSGVSVPGNVSVIGIDDIFFSCLARPPLTTISVPREQLGIKAFEALERMLKVKRHRGITYRLETDLIVRKSTALAGGKKIKIKSKS